MPDLVYVPPQNGLLGWRCQCLQLRQGLAVQHLERIHVFRQHVIERSHACFVDEEFGALGCGLLLLESSEQTAFEVQQDQLKAKLKLD